MENLRTKREISVRIFLAGVMAVGVFLISGWVLTKFVRFSGPDCREGVRSSLWQLGSFIDAIILEEEARPAAERVNRAIELAFQGGTQEESPSSALSRWAVGVSRDPHLGSLDSPPVFAEMNDLPNGFGFYWRGVDGISNSGGEDPDDINTWEPESGQFYKDLTERSILLKYSALAMIPTLVAFACLIRLTGKQSFRERLASIVEQVFLWVGIPIGILTIFGLVAAIAIFGFPLSRSGNFTPSWRSELPPTAIEVHETGSGEKLIGDYSYLLRAKVTEEEFIVFCKRLELTPHTPEREYEDDMGYGVSWDGYPPACGGWWVPTEAIGETFVWQKGRTWSYAKYEDGYLFFRSFKH